MSLCKWRLNIGALILLLLNVSTHLSIRSHCYHLLRYRLLRSRLINWACVFITDIRNSGKYKTLLLLMKCLIGQELMLLIECSSSSHLCLIQVSGPRNPCTRLRLCKYMMFLVGNDGLLLNKHFLVHLCLGRLVLLLLNLLLR